MNSYLVFEIRIWLVLVLVLLVLAAAAVGVWFLLRWIRRSRDAAVQETRAAAEADALQRRNRMLIRLDHELKNPLTALRTSVATVRSAAEEDAPDGKIISQSARQIDTSARRVARLLADLRKLADVESRSIDYRRVDMDALIQQAVEDARTAPGAEDRMIVATVARAPWKLPDVLGEEDLLLSAILNLLGNAIKYSSDTDTVELRANEQIIDKHRWVVVEVADTGSGIPVEEQQSVWDELHRGSRVRSVAGSGMGLSLVRAIVTRHGGSVELFSQEGIGTSVRLVIPVLGDAPPPGELEGYGARAAAGSRPVQPFQDQKAHTGPGAGQILPPREPNSEERRIMGTPRRTSKRRIQSVNGELVDTSTGENFGPTGGQQGQSGPGFDSGPYRRFKPPHPSGGAPSGPQPQGTPPPGGQASGVPGPVGAPGAQTPYGSAPGAPAQYGSGPTPQAPHGSGPAPQPPYGSGPGPHPPTGSGPPPSRGPGGPAPQNGPGTGDPGDGERTP
ncbi:sensor histidine kinase [Brevibacterium yomogidense]|uniref:histidine kinase n=1 Tax=Brevibacterium yomogidense TaxID=946573 RepID=A0A1X6XDH3_9MICO|nr:HAMP domain-containing sensor histidine kinase [Brevibacterium yomogidense]SLM96667.1 hypothetical protein FM105_06135 [Brevibacterium yomogidense]